jgi:hypothetical protein
VLAASTQWAYDMHLRLNWGREPLDLAMVGGEGGEGEEAMSGVEMGGKSRNAAR